VGGWFDWQAGCISGLHDTPGGGDGVRAWAPFLVGGRAYGAEGPRPIRTVVRVVAQGPKTTSMIWGGGGGGAEAVSVGRFGVNAEHPPGGGERIVASRCRQRPASIRGPFRRCCAVSSRLCAGIRGGRIGVAGVLCQQQQRPSARYPGAVAGNELVRLTVRCDRPAGTARSAPARRRLLVVVQGSRGSHRGIAGPVRHIWP